MEPPVPPLKDVKWSSASFPLDLLVSSYRLPQLARADCGENIEGLRENDCLLIHSCRQWTTITAHSLEEGHYVIGPKIEIPVHYGGQFKLLEQDRDIKEPVQYFNSVEEVAKAFPERVYVMEEITFNVKVASGECNEDTEVYNITLCTGDELTLMGQAEILYAKTSKEKSRLNTIFKKIGKLNSISKLGKGKMPCLICMNHRTNESISLPFQCKGRFSTRSPLEIQMQEGEHTIRNIVEKTRLPVNVTVPSPPPRNPYDLHFIREGHRYKFVNIQTKTVVVCCVLQGNKIIPMHFPLHLSVPKFSLPENLVKGEVWQDSVVQHWYNTCQEQFDIEEYSRAVRDVKADWSEECKSPKKTWCSGHSHIPNSLSYARDELTQSFHRLSVCVYGNNLHGNSEVNLHGCRDLCGDWAVFPQDSPQYQDSCDSGSDYLFPESSEELTSLPAKPELPYEELWLEQGSVKRSAQPLTRSQSEKNKCDPFRGSLPSRCGTSSLPSPGSLLTTKSLDVSLPPPPVPPKSEAVKEECRLLNAPPVPPRSSKPSSPTPSVSPAAGKIARQQTRSPSPTLSYYSSGLHSIGITESETTNSSDNSQVSCYPCNWIKNESVGLESDLTCGSTSSEALPSRLSWPNRYCGGAEGLNVNDLPMDQCRSYYSYPRQKTPGTPKKNCPAPFDFGGCGSFTGCNQVAQGDLSDIVPGCPKSASYSLESSTDRMISDNSTKQSLSCPALPPRAPKSSEGNALLEPLSLPMKIDGAEEEIQTCSPDFSEEHYLAKKGVQDIFSISYPFSSPLHMQLAPRSCGDGSPWQPPTDLSGLSVEEVSKSLRFIGLSEDVVSFFVSEKIDGNLLVQLTEEILSEDFKLSKLQVKKLLQFINGWRPKM
ncbi:GRB2-associated and regulator of MAPK protein 1 isoform X2 [Xenopus tropicalis]|uniref:GRB2-associated and regulator of MAPK1 n=1 Tax=Xenopus tropicalis TaxID=8364 RepID=F7ETG3_XENTR|nr:GRB2-associated and regulator of MAPK protein 1 isoform X2 [Xenopus tropicalis]|eukprot:XP_004915258.1 PREDICTED: GRB2-associated and regulator of MAPK protein 1 isoform X2 [Xenopus tropicalis]